MSGLANATLYGIRVTPRKLSLLANEVRGKDIQFALNYLQFSPRKRVAKIVRELLKSAVANAADKGVANVDQLIVSQILVGKGPTLKRFHARAKGSGAPIMKRTSHLKVTVGLKA